jgi:hypothetical protein
MEGRVVNLRQLFVNYKSQRKAKRVGKGGQKPAMAAAKKIQARVMLGDLSLLEGRMAGR